MSHATAPITWTVETAVGVLSTNDYAEARAWNVEHPGSSLDRADNR